MPGKRLIVAAAAATSVAAGLFGWAQAAQAGTAATLIGTVTATQYNGFCDDFGAQVRVTVAGGEAATKYTVWGTGFMQAPVTFTTNSKGAGTVDLHNIGVPTGGSVGSAMILVSTSFYTVTVPAQINCPTGEGG